MRLTFKYDEEYRSGMTVGIAAISQEEDDPKIVLAADRMITTGQNPRIEYEHIRSKIQSVHDNDVVSCMAVASGTVSFIEGFFDRLDDELSDSDPATVGQIAETARDQYATLGRKTVDNQVLSQFDLTISEITSGDPPFESEILSSILSDVADAQDRFSQQLEVVIGGIDGLGAHIYSIQNFDLDPQNTIGYHAVGSGTQPARSAFIRNEYDPRWGIDQGIINTIEAKRQSEEARGVGSEMDIAVVTMPEAGAECCVKFDEERKNKWTDLYGKIVDAENESREDTISEESVEYASDQ